jgi:hypothetical protein
MPAAALHVWRDGLAPLLSDGALRSLRDALRRDDALLLQGATTSPPPLLGVGDYPVERACPVAYCGLAEGLETVAEVEEFFARMCWACDQALGEAAAVKHFLNHRDYAPRAEVVAGLLAEVEAEVARRNSVGEDAEPTAAAPSAALVNSRCCG